MRQPTRALRAVLGVIAGVLLAVLGRALEWKALFAGGVLVSGLAAGWPFVLAVREGVLPTRGVPLERKTSPVRFWLSVALGGLLVTAWTLAGILKVFGLIGRS